MIPNFQAAREAMVESQVRTQDVTNLTIQDAMRRVPREAFVPEEQRFRAYADAEIPWARGRWMLRPRDIGKLLQALAPRPRERALAISAPYGAAVLREIGLAVQECDAAELGGVLGIFEVILCEGAVAKTPKAWLEALAEGGRLGVIERDGPVGRARLYLRVGRKIASRTLFDATPPILAGFEAPRVFQF
ncbi:MAG: protein-L-isoaspartate O-methyltransferase family protein [Caulobacteraceae bacterium]